MHTNEDETLNSQATAQARAKRLKRLRNLANLSRKELSEKYGVNINTLKGWELARHGGLTDKGANSILRILKNEGVKCTLDWILYGLGDGPKVFEKTDEITAAHMDLDKKLESLVLDEKHQIIEELLTFKKHNKNAIEYIITDNGMTPCFSINDYVAGNRRYGRDIAKVVGLHCIVQTKNGESFFRNLRVGSNENVYTLVCINIQDDTKELVKYDVELVSAAPVIWHRKFDPE